jgi:hypothetical protein
MIIIIHDDKNVDNDRDGGGELKLQFCAFERDIAD